MKVILLRDVAKIGRRNTVVEVPDGFALNRLIPNKDAIPATQSNLKSLKEKVCQSTAHDEDTIRMVAELARQLNEAKLVLPLRANVQGHLYEALSPALVVQAAKDVGITLDKKLISVPPAHKELGECEVSLKVLGETFSFKINLVAS